MRVLLDECTPRMVKSTYRLTTSARCRRWVGLASKNGELPTLAESLFEVFITTDKNLRHQQNLSERKLAVILLPGNQVPLIEAVMHKLDAALKTIKAGDFLEIPPL